MKFKVDENLPIEVAGSLRQAGYDAATVSEQHLEGSPDSDIASACQQEGRVLITLDTDFADIRAYPPGILKHLPHIMKPEPYWSGVFSEILIIGIIIVGIALAITSIFALRSTQESTDNGSKN